MLLKSTDISGRGVSGTVAIFLATRGVDSNNRASKQCFGLLRPAWSAAFAVFLAQDMFLVTQVYLPSGLRGVVVMSRNTVI